MAATGEARRLRQAAGATQGEVAQAAGVYTSTVARWETGQRVPRGQAALRYARVLARLANEAQAGKPS